MPGMPSALITGITGQDGLYLAELLLAKGYDVHGLIRGQNNPRRDLVERLLPDVRLHNGDLTDMSSLIRALRDSEPDEVYNLGAISFVAFSWQNAALTTDVTGKGVLTMLEAVRLHAGDDPSAVRFYQASSSEMFGKVQEVPQRETTLLWPRSPYGVAKVFGHYMTINYRESYGMHASSGILFNHESPRRGPEFVTRKISQAVARIHLGTQKDIVLGNLDAERDWGFAGDYVEAMWLMLQQEQADDYVIATGETHSIRDFLAAAFAHVGIDDWEPYVKQDERFMRPAEVDQLIGDASKARAGPRLGAEGQLRRARGDDGRRRHRGPTSRLVSRLVTRAFVTGIGGQDGSYLAERLLADGLEVHALVFDRRRRRPSTAPPTWCCTAATSPTWPPYAPCCSTSTRTRSTTSPPSARSPSPGHEPDLTARVNGLGAAGLLESALARAGDGTGTAVAFVQASSAEMFGQPATTPQDESTPLAPVSPYGAAKAFAHLAVGVYRRPRPPRRAARSSTTTSRPAGPSAS